MISQVDKNEMQQMRKNAIKSIFTKQCWKYFLISSFLSVIQVVAYVSVALLLQYLNDATNKDNLLFPSLGAGSPQIAVLVPLLIGISIVSFLFGLLGNRYSIGFAKQVSINLRNMIYSKVQTFSMVDIENFSQSSLINRLTIDITTIATASEFATRVLLRSIILYFGGLIGMIMLIISNNSQVPQTSGVPSYSIVLIIVGISLLLILIIIIIALLAMKWFNVTQQNLDKINGLMQENVLGQRVVKSFNLQDYQFQTFDKQNEKLRYSSTRAGYIMAAVLPSIYFFLDLSLVLSTWLSNKETINSLLSIYLLMSLMIIALVLAIVGIVQVSRSVPCFKRSFEVLLYKPTIIYPEEEIKLSNKNSIEISNVSFRYPKSEQNSLTNINLSIKPNEVVGIIGPTGSGKSTLINLLARMYDTTNGTIKICEQEIKKLTKHQLKSIISYCPQTIVLFEGTFKSNLLFGDPNATEKDMIDATKLSSLYDFISEKPKQFDEPITQRATNLSGGQKQRLAIARTLIKKSPVLLLDDATSALDMLTEKNICSELIKNPNKQTILISSQRINAIKNADKIIVMNEGKIIAEGKHLDLLKTCKYYHDVAVIQLGKKEVEHEIGQK